VIRVIEIGDTARRSIDGASVATVVAALSRSLYLEVGGEIVWLGPPGSTLHRRAIVADEGPDPDGATRIETAFDLRIARDWRPHHVGPEVDAAIFARESRRLVRVIDRLGAPDGFGALLVGRRPAFPLDRAAEGARGFLEACARGDAASATALGEPLLGLGPGLTPAGDDLVGGAFFARRLIGRWADAAATIRTRARRRTHPISATLLGDLVDGFGHAPLHDLALAFVRSDGAAALDAAARLARIGHSSGWDMLTGFLGALGGMHAESMA
jgi:Protein of unknown function (DUF2877)